MIEKFLSIGGAPGGAIESRDRLAEPSVQRGPQPRGGLKRGAALVVLGAGLTLLFFILRFIVTNPVGTLDFVNLYTAGAIVRAGSSTSLYNLTLQRRIQAELAPGGQFLPFDHPPFEAWLCLPLAFLPFPQSYLLWAGLNLLVLGMVFLGLRRTDYRLEVDGRLVWLAASVPLAGGTLVLGQDSLLLAPIFLFAFLALKRGRDAVAGLVLGLGLYRFEIVLPFVFVFFLRRRWRLLAGFSITAVAALLASASLVGWSGLAQYARVLVEVGRATGSQAVGVQVADMPSLRGALAAFFGASIPPPMLFPLALAGTLALLAWAAWEFRSVGEPGDPAFDLQFCFAAIAALLASYHLFVHELTPLIVLSFLLLGCEGAARRSEALLLRPGAQLLVLFSLLVVVGELAGFRAFSVVFVVLLGMLAWLATELAEIRASSNPRGESANLASP